MFDPRIGRWCATDKAEKKYPNLSAYNFCNNNPLIFKDIDGNDIFIVIVQGGNRKLVKYDRNMVIDDYNLGAKETIKALNELYDSKSLEVNFEIEKESKSINMMSEFLLKP